MGMGMGYVMIYTLCDVYVCLRKMINQLKN
jgi:hypothetical protein